MTIRGPRELFELLVTEDVTYHDIAVGDVVLVDDYPFLVARIQWYLPMVLMLSDADGNGVAYPYHWTARRVVRSALRRPPSDIDAIGGWR